MNGLTLELSGTYIRRTDGRSLSYCARLDGTHYQLRVWPAVTPADIYIEPPGCRCGCGGRGSGRWR